MPRKNGDVDLRELRQAAQQAYFGLAGVTRDKTRRKAARAAVKAMLKAHNLVIRGEQNEVVDPLHQDTLIDGALDDIEGFTTDPPEP